jgi:L-rhamnose mutarotase
MKTAIQKLSLGAGAALLMSPFLCSTALGRATVSIAGAGLILTSFGNPGKEEQQSLRKYLGQGATSWMREAKPEVRRLAHQIQPLELREASLTLINNTGQSEDYVQKFKDFHDQSWAAVAQTGGGKTWILHQSQRVTCELGHQHLILDKSYGKRADLETGFGYWHFAPLGSTVFRYDENNPQGLADFLRTAYELRQERADAVFEAAQAQKQSPKFTPYWFYITEWNETWNHYTKFYKSNQALDSDEQIPLNSPEELDRWKDSVFFDGHGYQVFMALDMQTAAAGVTDINEAQRAQVNWLLLGSAAINDKELLKFGLKPKQWIPRVQAMRKLPGKARAGIMINKGKASLFVPTEVPVQLDFRNQISEKEEAQKWLQYYEPQILEWLKDNNHSPSKAFDMRWKEIFPTGKQNRSKNNPYWAEFYQLIEGARIS